MQKATRNTVLDKNRVDSSTVGEKNMARRMTVQTLINAGKKKLKPEYEGLFQACLSLFSNSGKTFGEQLENYPKVVASTPKGDVLLTVEQLLAVLIPRLLVKGSITAEQAEVPRVACR